MEKVNNRSMDLTIHSRLPDRVYSHTQANQGTESDSNEWGKTSRLFTRNREYDSQRSSKNCERLSRSIFVDNFCSPEKIGGISAGIQSKDSESLCSVGALQNGINPDGKTFGKGKERDDITRPERCLFYGPNMPASQKVPAVQMGRCATRVSSATVWIEDSSSTVYKNSKAGGISSKAEVHESDYLSRRSSCGSPIGRRMSEPETLHPPTVTGFRFGSKLGKVASSPDSSNQVSRAHYRYCINDVEPSRGKSSPSRKIMQRGDKKSVAVSRSPGKPVRQDERHIRRCSSGPGLFPCPANQFDSGGSEGHVISESGEAITSEYTGTSMVVHMSKKMERQEINPPLPCNDYHIRCFNARVGCPLSDGTDRGQMDSERDGTSYKLPGITSSLPSAAVFRQESTGLSHNGTVGQHHSDSIYQTQRGHPHGQFVAVGNPNVEMVYAEEDHSYCIPRTRSGKSNSGFSIPSVCGQIGMDAQSGNFSPSLQEANILANCRPVCIQDQSSGSPLCGMETGSGSNLDRCVLEVVDERTAVCISALLSLGSGVEEGGNRGNNGTSNSPGLDNSGLVSNVDSDVNCRAYSPPSRGSCPLPTAFRAATPLKHIDASSGMACLREQFSSRGFSESVAEVLLDSCRHSTHKQYQSSWRAWCGWCVERHLSPISASVNAIMEFLVACEAKGLSYRTLGVYRSAISLYHERVANVPVGQNPDICKLMKGFFNRNPPRPRYTVTWDVQPVLLYLSNMPRWDKLSLKMLTLKMVLLLALVSLGRVSSLVNIDISNLVVSSSCLKFVPSKLRKQSRPGHVLRCVVVEAYGDRTLCPVSAVSAYLSKTKSLRGSEAQLLISHIRPHKKVGSSTVSRWMIEMLDTAGVDTSRFKAHSTRGAASSASLKLGVSMKDILEAAGWCSDSTFSRFYHRPSANSMIARALLNVASKSPIDSKPKEDAV